MQTLFYFANSPAGGGQVRLNAYVKHSETGNLFVTNSKSRHLDSDHVTNAQIENITVNKFVRAFDENHYLRQFDCRERVIFSHGAPLYPKECRGYILHINNALPFVWDKVCLGLKKRAEMRLLLRRLAKASKIADIITVESYSTRQLLLDYCRDFDPLKIRILSNGVDEFRDKTPSCNAVRYALTIGTYPYKRISEVARWFRVIKRNFDIEKLVILSTTGDKVDLRLNDDIQVMTSIPHVDSRKLTRDCSLFISFSQIENCSISLLEAIYHKRHIICSSIPAHIEFLEKHGYILEWVDVGVISALPPRDLIVPVPSWSDICAETLQIIHQF